MPSLLRGFSAPVDARERRPTTARLRFLMAHDSDPFVRWEAGPELRAAADAGAGRARAARAARSRSTTASPRPSPRRSRDPRLEPAFVAQALSLPSEGYVGEQMAEIDVDGIHAVREFLRAALGRRLAAPLAPRLPRRSRATSPTASRPAQVGRRALRNLALGYLMAAGGAEGRRLCLAQFAERRQHDRHDRGARPAGRERPARARARRSPASTSAGGTTRWWSTSGSRCRRWRSAPDAVDGGRGLLDHEAFTLENPNRVRALIGAFARGNPTGFHRADGAGYALRRRPACSRSTRATRRSPRASPSRSAAGGATTPAARTLMRAQLERILAAPNLSRDVFEIASKSLQ